MYDVMFMVTPHQGGSEVTFGRLVVDVASVFVAADDLLLRNLPVLNVAPAAHRFEARPSPRRR
jgi:hypothetical protein